jgi:hypothetical protein
MAENNLIGKIEQAAVTTESRPEGGSRA